MQFLKISLLVWGGLLAILGLLLGGLRQHPGSAYLVLLPEYEHGRLSYYTLISDGSNKRTLPLPSQNYLDNIFWLDDGSAMLAVFSLEKGIFQVDARTGARQLIDPHEVIGDIVNFKPSPDKKWLAFVVLEGAYHQLYLTKADGTEGRVLTDDLKGYVVPASILWSGDNQWIYFRWCKGTDCPYYKIQPVTGEMVALPQPVSDMNEARFCGWLKGNGEIVELLTLTDNAGPYGAMTFSPDGELLALVNWTGDLQIYRVADGELLKTIPVDNMALIDFTPDGLYLGVMVNGLLELWGVPAQ